MNTVQQASFPIVTKTTNTTTNSITYYRNALNNTRALLESPMTIVTKTTIITLPRDTQIDVQHIRAVKSGLSVTCTAQVPNKPPVTITTHHAVLCAALGIE